MSGIKASIYKLCGGFEWVVGRLWVVVCLAEPTPKHRFPKPGQMGLFASRGKMKKLRQNADSHNVKEKSKLKRQQTKRHFVVAFRRDLGLDPDQVPHFSIL